MLSSTSDAKLDALATMVAAAQDDPDAIKAVVTANADPTPLVIALATFACWMVRTLGSAADDPVTAADPVPFLESVRDDQLDKLMDGWGDSGATG